MLALLLAEACELHTLRKKTGRGVLSVVPGSENYGVCCSDHSDVVDAMLT